MTGESRRGSYRTPEMSEDEDNGLNLRSTDDDVDDRTESDLLLKHPGSDTSSQVDAIDFGGNLTEEQIYQIKLAKNTKHLVALTVGALIVTTFMFVGYFVTPRIPSFNIGDPTFQGQGYFEGDYFHLKTNLTWKIRNRNYFDLRLTKCNFTIFHRGMYAGYLVVNDTLVPGRQLLTYANSDVHLDIDKVLLRFLYFDSLNSGLVKLSFNGTADVEYLKAHITLHLNEHKWIKIPFIRKISLHLFFGVSHNELRCIWCPLTGCHRPVRKCIQLGFYIFSSSQMGNSTSIDEIRRGDIQARKERQDAERARLDAIERQKREEIYARGILLTLQAACRGLLSRKLHQEWKTMEVRRSRIAAEILSTEQSYVNSLHILIQTYLRPLSVVALTNEQKLPASTSSRRADLTAEENDNSAPPTLRIITSGDVRKIFSEIEVIHSYNTSIMVNRLFLTRFLTNGQSQLESRVNVWCWTQQLGDIFLALSDFLKIYVAYVNNYDVALGTIEKLQTQEPLFNDYLRWAQDNHPECNHLPLNAFLIMPIQVTQRQTFRIPRYVMLLTDLDKNTPDYHIDKDNLSEALEKVKGVASLINDKKKEAEYFNILISLYNRLEPKVEDLCEAHRRLIRFGPAKYAGEIHQLYLMNDMLLITQEKSNQRLKLVEKINIDNYAQIVSIRRENDTKNRQLFRLQSGANAYSFKVKTKEEKKEWLGDIQKYIQDSQMKVISFQQSPKNIDEVPDAPNAELLSKLQLSPRGVQKERRHSIDASHTDVRGKTGSFRHSMDSTSFGLPPPISDEHHLTTLGLHRSVITEEPPAPTEVKETKNNSRSNYAAFDHTMASTVIPTAFLQAGSVAPILKPVKRGEGQVQKSPSQPEDEKTERKVVTHKTTTQEGSSAVQRTVTVTPPSSNWKERTSPEPEATLSPSDRRKQFRASMALHRGAKPEQ
ncbi:hypothetical protein PROFUN_00426 [Planoprotostelium fungivorum]|uniref:Uncharacterized protein n=1 Tax=Planoprotostelium fungivorum TaxID=1890364 RepID=A0A2P6N0T6_9EUKA|nr:hypothetical protein PROFUN_00426 [Planoprotostelium fungivorum]